MRELRQLLMPMESHVPGNWRAQFGKQLGETQVELCAPMPTSHTQYPGVEAAKDHGLAGIPFLPKEPVDAFPPSQSVEVLPVSARTVKQRFALVPISC
jgi:hypothetical protein